MNSNIITVFWNRRDADTLLGKVADLLGDFPKFLSVDGIRHTETVRDNHFRLLDSLGQTVANNEDKSFNCMSTSNILRRSLIFTELQQSHDTYLLALAIHSIDHKLEDDR
jgi:hypothetical protein